MQSCYLASRLFALKRKTGALILVALALFSAVMSYPAMTPQIAKGEPGREKERDFNWLGWRPEKPSLRNDK